MISRKSDSNTDLLYASREFLVCVWPFCTVVTVEYEVPVSFNSCDIRCSIESLRHIFVVVDVFLTMVVCTELNVKLRLGFELSAKLPGRLLFQISSSE